MIAASNGYQECLLILLAHGAKVDKSVAESVSTIIGQYGVGSVIIACLLDA